jgi:hypothetical protein
MPASNPIKEYPAGTRLRTHGAEQREAVGSRPKCLQERGKWQNTRDGFEKPRTRRVHTSGRRSLRERLLRRKLWTARRSVPQRRADYQSAAGCQPAPQVLQNQHEGGGFLESVNAARMSVLFPQGGQELV